MSKELVIGSNRHETKVAILEEDQLVEVYFQRGNEYSLAGSIHKGRVTRVLPGMQSAFVDLGLERDTFLYVSDFSEEQEDIDTVEERPTARNNRRERGERERWQQPPQQQITAPISEVVSAPAEDTGISEVFVAEREEIESSAPETILESGAAGVAGVPSFEQRSQDAQGRSDNDRGDRRGRRSRRRRTRGHGFPDNKYAQPGAAPGARTGGHAGDAAGFREDREEGRREEGFPGEGRRGERAAVIEEETDVLILPGESLAKYRRPASHAEDFDAGARAIAEEPAVHPSEEEEQAAEEAAAEDAAEQEEIRAEAEEIELADRILSHRGSRPLEEELTLAEVKQEEHVSPFIATDVEEEETEVVEPAVYAVEPVTTFPDVPDIGPTLAATAHVPAEAQEAFIPEGLSASERTEDELSAELEEDETDVVEPATAEELHGAEAVSEATGAPLASETAVNEGEPAAAQSASVRETGDRFMHRVGGRRMRRRRGGNRNFGSRDAGGREAGGRESSARGPGSSAAEGSELRTSTEAGAAVATEGRLDAAPSESRQESREERSYERPERALPSITELLKPGQEIIVQIAKEPLGQKGARITSHIALPGRFVVFMPSVTHLGVSRKIDSDEERQRLKRILQTHREGTTGGFIVRTAGEGVPEEEIAADMDFLYKLWLDIRQKAEKRPAPMLLHCDLDVVQRILRDQVTEEYKSIWVDNEEMYENVLSFMQRFQPGLVNRVKMYTRSAPIFDAFGITPELEKALRPKVWLKSGGYIVINQTEALVAIDINTGKYVGKSNRLEDTIVKTNIEAVKEIVRQIRLRDLGGIIVVDFIDMDERKNRQKVMQALEEAMRVDKAPYKILQFNDFGLVAITRKRVKQSLERTLCSPCPYCEGAGYVKSVQTVIGEILAEAQKLAKAIEGKDVLLRVHPEVAKVLKANDNRFLEESEEILGRPVLVKSDPSLHMEKFDLG